MGKINLKRVYHLGIPVNDLERAERFYVDVLGMKVCGNPVDANGKRNYRVSDDNRPWRDILGYWPEALRLRCADDNIEVVLVKRPKPLVRDWKEDSFNHTAFSASKEDFDLFLEKARVGSQLSFGTRETQEQSNFVFLRSRWELLSVGR